MRTIHFILAANNLSSQTRVAVEFSNHLVEKGYEAVVSVPYFDFIDFVLWHLRRDDRQRRGRLSSLYRWGAWLYLPLLKSMLQRKPWVGPSGYRVDPRVRVNRFWTVPNAGNMPDADRIVASQCYLLPRLLRLPARKGKVVGSIRLDYQAGIEDSDPKVSQWRVFCNAFYQRLDVPLFAVSQRSRESAVALGIPVEEVIENGVNTEEFSDGGRRGPLEPVRVTLFGNDHPQKGQDFGCAVIRRLRSESFGKRILFCAAGGRVKPCYRDLFDVDYGYLTGKDYVRMFQETDIFLFPSLYEGFPAVPLEAMACGCALATTRVSGVEEYAAHGKNCMVCLPNDVETMAANVRTLILDVTLRDGLRENALSTVKRYSWDVATEKLIRFLENPDGDRKSPPANRPEMVEQWT